MSERGQVDLANMAEQVNVGDAKDRLSELLHRVERGEQITIARAGVPVAKLVPAAAPPLRRELGFLPELAGIPDEFFAPLDETELVEWEGVLDEEW